MHGNSKLQAEEAASRNRDPSTGESCVVHYFQGKNWYHGEKILVH